jgi:hypothetical protein
LFDTFKLSLASLTVKDIKYSIIAMLGFKRAKNLADESQRLIDTSATLDKTWLRVF